MTVPASSEAQLARDLMSGSTDAFNHFVETYHSKLFRYSFSVCGHRQDAEEVAQDTLLKVFENLDQLREPEHLKAWVFRIAKNACLMKRRKSLFAPSGEISLNELRPARNGSTEKLDIADWSALPDELAADEELRHALSEAVQKLPEKYKVVFLLRDVEGLSTEAAAQALEISEDAVKQRLHRAGLSLRQALDMYAKERV